MIFYILKEKFDLKIRKMFRYETLLDIKKYHFLHIFSLIKMYFFLFLVKIEKPYVNYKITYLQGYSLSYNIK